MRQKYRMLLALKGQGGEPRGTIIIAINVIGNWKCRYIDNEIRRICKEIVG